jgi:hypothetical protein
MDLSSIPSDIRRRRTGVTEIRAVGHDGSPSNSWSCAEGPGAIGADGRFVVVLASACLMAFTSFFTGGAFVAALRY